MTENQKQLLTDAYRERAKIKVILVSNPNNALIQFVGNLMFNAYNRAIENKERKWSKLV